MSWLLRIVSMSLFINKIRRCEFFSGRGWGGGAPIRKWRGCWKKLYQNLALWAWARLARIHFHSYEVPILRLEVIIVFPVIFSDRLPYKVLKTCNYSGVHIFYDDPLSGTEPLTPPGYTPWGIPWHLIGLGVTSTPSFCIGVPLPPPPREFSSSLTGGPRLRLVQLWANKITKSLLLHLNRKSLVNKIFTFLLIQRERHLKRLITCTRSLYLGRQHIERVSSGGFFL